LTILFLFFDKIVLHGIQFCTCTFILVARGTKCDAQIIIGTPGTVLNWVMRHRAFEPKKISVFVLDEADIMISQQGHQDQSIRIKK